MRGEAAQRAGARLRRKLVDGLDRSGHGRTAIRSEAVRQAFLEVPRELFVPELAAAEGLEAVYRDQAIVTKKDARGASVSSSSQPGIMAPMLDELDLRSGLRVLEIGAGTGYNAALMSTIVGPRGRVVSVDIDPDTASRARRVLRSGGYKARLVAGDGRDGWHAGAPYDRIMVTASSLEVPSALSDQLAAAGLLELPLRFSEFRHGPQAIVVLRKSGPGLDSIKVFPGSFMGIRGEARSPAPGLGAHVGATETVDGSWHGHTSLTGRPLGRLGGPGRRRLLSIALQGPEVTPLGLRAPVYVLLVFMSLALPDAVLVESRRSDGAGIGIVDHDGAGLTLLAGTHRHITRIERYGKAPAPKPLLDALEEWVALGRPGLADLRINVSYRRRPRSRGVWRAVRRGPSVMCFDWARRAP